MRSAKYIILWGVCTIVSAIISVTVWVTVSKERIEWNSNAAMHEVDYSAHYAWYEEHRTGPLETYECGCLTNTLDESTDCLECQRASIEYYVTLSVNLDEGAPRLFRCTAFDYGVTCSALNVCVLRTYYRPSLVIYYQRDDPSDYVCNDQEKESHVWIVIVFASLAGLLLVGGNIYWLVTRRPPRQEPREPSSSSDHLSSSFDWTGPPSTLSEPSPDGTSDSTSGVPPHYQRSIEQSSQNSSSSAGNGKQA